MTEQLHSDNNTLVDEIVRCLAAVELSRACDCEPTWRLEMTRDMERVRSAEGEHARSAH
jgi:hypothetical protein